MLRTTQPRILSCTKPNWSASRPSVQSAPRTTTTTIATATLSTFASRPLVAARSLTSSVAFNASRAPSVLVKFARQTASVVQSSSSRSFSSTAAPKYEHLLVEVKGKVGVITLNRPKALNALCDALVGELNQQLKIFDKDSNIGCIVITGSEKAFAAGADIKEMAPKTLMEAYKTNMLAHWHDLVKIRKPVIAAVNGFALGGGCELAMMCDIIIAGDKAKFGQPEIQLGTIPGCGGTQRLTRAVGKSKAMEWILTGNFFSAEEAEKCGLVSRVVPADKLLASALETADKIASYSLPIAAMAKEAVNAAYEHSLEQGVLFERRLFHSTFGTKDQKEGMDAFASKRKPTFTNE